MCTKDRPRFVAKSLKMFKNQTHKNKELIIIDDSDEKDLSTEAKSAKLTNVHYIHLKTKHSIGEKRNMGIRLASGEVILIWDDDDYHGPNRIENQLNRLIASKKSLMVYNSCTYYSIPLQILFAFSQYFHNRIWKYGYVAGTAMFYKTIWDHGKYPNVSFREDILFIEKAMQNGFDIGVMKIPKNDFVYVKHQTSTLHISVDKAIYKKPLKLNDLYKGNFNTV